MSVSHDMAAAAKVRDFERALCAAFAISWAVDGIAGLCEPLPTPEQKEKADTVLREARADLVKLVAGGFHLRDLKTYL